MKLTLQIKLLPDTAQAKSLLTTIEKANCICTQVSEIAWNEKIFNQFKQNKLMYQLMLIQANI